MKFWSFLLALPLFILQGNSVADTVIRVAAQEASEPKFITVSQQGKPAIGGICIDIMRAMEKISPELHFVGDQTWLPRVRIDAAMKAGDIDAICGVQRIARNTTQYDFLDTVLFSVSYLLAVRADDDIDIQNWNDIRQLGDNGVILALHGFGIVDILKNKGGLKIDASATSSSSNLNKLIAGRGRFYCHRSPGIKLSIQQAGLEQKIRLLSKPQLTEKFYMGLSKTLPAEKAKKINAALVLLENSGELRRIVEKYQE
ncbi:substrate-binding periplasmic protein [Undibacterium rugosum]|uniref:Transporter substrate-binding domain-containing protein n=1 Tax=Undibacterium rugosum TaxID=2762291 RepID=A0A923I3T4_9BURK|nr:transporter substrate-binding domain-containing protein [Undibacterium rugosum]MBC3937229.1 transporter substrate-binding domain-containing protein [Undibacterium rugosum]MBR7779290.1 transporter substrate-binding domain-containing protein [Undibacterium rugosum]